MQKGDKNQQDLPRASDQEIPETLGPTSEAIIHTTTSLESSHKIASYHDAVKVLSEVELPSPTPMLATTGGSLTEESNVIRLLHEGQSSGTKRKAADVIEGNVERERELKNQLQHDFRFRDPGHQRVTTDTNATNKRRRNLISERIRGLRALVPNCNKRDEASILSDAIEYIKYLQMQVQTMSTQGLNYMFLARQPSWQVPNLGPPFSVRPLIGMQQDIPQYGFYVPANIPIFPPAFSGFPPLMPPMEVGSGSLMPWQQPSPLLYPQQLQFPLQQFSAQTSGYSTAPSSGIIIPTSSQAGSPVPGQPSYHVPMTTQGTS